MDLSVFFEHPEAIGREVGFKDLTPLHGRWIRKMVFGSGDYTLQAHRGSFKSSCLAVAISILLVFWPDRNIIFLRKTDGDVSEMLGMTKFLIAEDDQEPDEDLTLEERVTRLEKRVAMLEAYDGAVG